MKIDILTLFPRMFDGVLQESIIKRAIEKDLVEIEAIDFRIFSEDKHNRVDDYPFGGGAGMVIKPEPIARALKSIEGYEDARVIYMSPKGSVLNQKKSNELAEDNHLIIICGHYEGIDQRFIDNYVDEEISIGDYVLTGGEIPAMALVDTIVRLLPDALGKQESYEEDSHYKGLLEYPHYTRPRVFEGEEVPEVLLSGHHANVDKWRHEKSLEITAKNRPDMIEKYDLTKNDIKYLKEKGYGIKK
ncbi:MAG: tRNA (guanosine(37)-N1)-methyltransferase TrmD [Tissierellales bacterium]|jgi:tRNA (guanine37-N1)-methyltransferase|nr:tRNA (guanosine(37)-N1)-methyltransferase TrmD [Tissierellales bacterium]